MFDNEVDVITMFHVFEHLSDPKVWLRKIAKHIKTNGILFIEVPNANDDLLALYKCQAFSDFTYWSAHLYLYTKESLTKLIVEEGSFIIGLDDQEQGYPIANHLYWL